MATFDEIYNKYSTNDSKREDDKEKKQEKTLSFDEIYNKYSVSETKNETQPTQTTQPTQPTAPTQPQTNTQHQTNKPATNGNNTYSPVQPQRPIAPEQYRIKHPQGPYATTWNQQIIPDPNQIKRPNEAQNQKTEQRTTESNFINNAAYAPSFNPTHTNKVNNIDAQYYQKASNASRTQQGPEVKQNYVREAQIEREIAILEMLDEEGEIGTSSEGFPLAPNLKHNTNQNYFAKTETQKILESRKSELEQIKTQNVPYRMNDIIIEGTFNNDLEVMYAHQHEPDFIEKYGSRITNSGIDANALFNQYKIAKAAEAFSNTEVLNLVSQMYEAEVNQENKGLTMLFNPNGYNGWASAYTDGTQTKGLQARDKLAAMGYDPEALLEQYSRNINKKTTEATSQYLNQLGQEHPIVATALSFPLNYGSGMGLIEVGKAALTGREVDPNSRFFGPVNATSALRSGVSEDYGTAGNIGYGIFTNIGDMLMSRLSPGGSIGYAAVQASQAAASSAQQGAEKGYSTGQIIANAVSAGALTAVCEKIGFDKVFKLTNANDVKSIALNVAKSILAEGGEEATEEAANIFAQNITNVIFNNQTEIQAEVNALVAQGYSTDEAFTKVLSGYGEQIGTALIMGGFAGGLINLYGNTINIFSNPNASQTEQQNPNIITQNQPPVDTGNQVSLPIETEASTGDFQPVTQSESVEPENDFEEIDNGEVDFETESNEPYDEYDEYLLGFEKYIAEYDEVAENPTPENVGRISQEIKTEFDSENYDGVTEEKVVPYTSGNSAVDAFVNTDGRLDTKITVDAQAEQNLIDKAQSMFGRTVRFVDTLDGANAYFDRKPNEIVIARDSQMKSVSAFGHEFAHSLEGTVEYSELKTHLQQNSLYIKNKLAEVGNNWDKLVDNKITEYQNALGITLSRPEAEYEIIADAIGTELFSDYKAMESLATQNRSLFTKFKQWFVRNFIGTRETRTKISNPKAAARKTYALMLRAEKAAKNRTQSGEGVAYNAKGTEYIDLSKDNELSKQLTGLRGSAKYKIIRDYILNALGDSDITLSDGKTATVDRSDALHIANLSGDKKTAQIAKIKQLINQAKLYAEDTNVSHKKFDYFCYYRANIKYGNDIYPVYLNVGKGINDQRYHLYDITEKIRDTVNRIDGFERPKPNEGYALENSISIDSIPNSSENVNNDVSYSAKKSDAVQRITENFGYSDVTANSIYKAARTLKQNTASKADTDELAYTIASMLENRRTGNTDGRDAEHIAMMLAESAEAVNEDFVAENKPILDRLNGMTISISEADISDLGDAFSYVRGKLFPYVTLKKGTDSSVDSIFQDLAADFPFAFDAEAVTHPADQVKAIMGFIENYRSNKYYRPYFEDSEAFDYLHTEIEAQLNDTKVDEASYLSKLEQLVEKYGELKNGVPKSTDGETKVRRAAASFYGSKPVIETPELAERFAKEIVNGKYDYEVMRQGKLATRYLDQIKSSDNVTEKVIEEYKRLYSLLTDRDHRITPTDVMQAAALNPMLAEVLSADDFVNYTMLVSEIGTSAGQIISSLRLINQFSPLQVLKAVQKKIDRINEKQSRHYVDEFETDAEADENGQFVSVDNPSMKDGVMEFIATKRKAKYPPIKIPAELQQELLTSRSRDETEAATDKIMQYVENQIHYSWFDKLSSFRYLAMLLNPKTVVKNTLGNASMSMVARGKDIAAASLSKLPIANKYRDSSTQTTAVVTSKDARKAALTLLGDSQGVVSLFSGQDKYTGKESLSSKSDAKLNKAEKKLAEMNPLIEVMLNNRSIQSTPLANSKVPIAGKAFEKISDFQQKTLDDTPFKILRAKTVLAQSITAAVNSGDIQNIDDFVAVALNQNTEHLDSATKIKYAQLYDTFCQQAAKEGDEATFRENNSLADKVNKLRQGTKFKDRMLTVLIDGAIPFVKTPANVAKRSLEYSPLGLGKSLIGDRYKLAKGEIDRNTYINNLAKGLTGTSIFALGALLSALGVISTDDGGDEEEKAEKQLLGGQDYAINIGNGSYTIDFLSPTSVPLFMGGKVYDEIVKAMNGEEVGALEAMFEVLMGVTGPLFAQTMLSGIDGALESVSRETAYGENEEGRSMLALVNYCAESWISQFMPTVLGAVARTSDDTVRTYYNDGKNSSEILGGIGYGIAKKVPGVNQTLPSKLDMWGQPVESGSLPERFLENFISPGYWEEDNTDKATKALHTFATANGINYSDIIPKKPGKKLELSNHKEITLTADEYELYAGEIGKARKDAVYRYLINGEDIEVTFTYYTIDPEKSSGFATHKYTYKGPLKTAENTVGWAPDKSDYGYYIYDDTGKPVAIHPASNKEFRAMLFEKVMEQATETGTGEAKKIIETKH